MPDNNTASGESDVELMAIVLDTQSHPHMRVCVKQRAQSKGLSLLLIGQNLQLHCSRIKRHMVHFSRGDCSWCSLNASTFKQRCSI